MDDHRWRVGDDLDERGNGIGRVGTRQGAQLGHALGHAAWVAGLAGLEWAPWHAALSAHAAGSLSAAKAPARSAADRTTAWNK